MSRRFLTVEQCARIERLRKQGLSFQEIAERMSISKSTVDKCCRRGFRQKAKLPEPAPACFGLYGATETMEQLQRRYRRGSETIRGWIAEKAIVRPNFRYTHPYREMPADFPELAPSMTIGEAEKHWNACYWLVTRWRTQIGLRRPRKGRHDRATEVTKIGTGWVERYVEDRRAA